MLPAGSRLLAEGRMGLLLRDGKTLKPDTRKGMLRAVRVRRQGPDQLAHAGRGAALVVAAAGAARGAGATRRPRRVATPPPPRAHPRLPPCAPQTEDGLVHLMWAERTDAGGVKDDAEMDAIVFPEEAAFTLVRR
jgi:hypothetical protein